MTNGGGNGSLLHAATRSIDGERLVTLIEEVAEYGRVGEGHGIDRQALTHTELELRRFLVDRARGHGATVERDRAGNFFFRWNGTERWAPVVTGSHIDTQPNGGSLDGAYGVCTGIELIAALSETGGQASRPIEVAIWTNEEGCRFAPGTMGSSAFVDPELLDCYVGSLDASGTSFGEALGVMERLFEDVPVRALGGEIRCFVEAHIEQGRQLEKAGVSVGVVEGIGGVRWFDVLVRGTPAHAGTTALGEKKDALMMVVNIASWLYSVLEAGDESLRVTIGRLMVAPGSINVVPGEARFSVDLRHPKEEVLDAVERGLRRQVDLASGGCGTIKRLMAMKPIMFDARVRNEITACARDLGLGVVEARSGAFHDAYHLAARWPSGMMFVPSIGGISHSPFERTQKEDLIAGARVLAETVLRFADI